jgi:hypothetical protein
MGHGKKIWVGVVGLGLWAAAVGLQAQDARQIVQQAVNSELQANRDDHTHWRYLEHEDDGDTYIVVETEHGAIKRHVDKAGQPAPQATLAADDAYIQRFIHDPTMQEKQRRDGAHDDKSATELLNLMPQAFVWNVESDAGDKTRLSFRPNPNFSPPDMEARVMGAMSGTMVVSHEGHRIKTFKGRLMSDVTIGFGLLARIKAGSTFDIERRQVLPGVWEITETHVHINGHALFFKTIGQQEDEVKSDFSLVPPGTTLEQAVGMLK